MNNKKKKIIKESKKELVDIINKTKNQKKDRKNKINLLKTSIKNIKSIKREEKVYNGRKKVLQNSVKVKELIASKKASFKKSKKEDIQLLEHQRKTLEYIIARCRKQHGLIVNHYMGTGKTKTGAVFLKNYPNHKYLIILPKGLENIWIKELNILGIDLSKVLFKTFDEIARFRKYINFNEYVCIIDEAHNLYKIIEGLGSFNLDMDDLLLDDESIKGSIKDEPFVNKSREELLIEFIDTLYSTHKILLLTGTLTKSGQISDIRWLINIAAGRSIVPFNIEEFHWRYKSTNMFEQFYLKYIHRIILKNPLDLLPREFTNLYRGANPGGQEKFDISHLIINLIKSNVLVKLTSLLTSKKLDADISIPKGSLLKQSQKQINTLQGISNKVKTAAIVLSTKLADTALNRKLLVSQYLALAVLIKGFTLTIMYLKDIYDQNYNFNQLNYKKLIDDNINKYISFYKYGEEAHDYPKVIEETKKVVYTVPQLQLLIKILLIPENITSEELVALRIKKTLREAELFKKRAVFDSSKYKNNGRIIGNLYNEPNKFIEILNIYMKNKNSTIVYSSFYESGILLFSEFLKKRNVKHVIYDHTLSVEEKNNIVRDFKDEKIKLILLHPDFYQGFNIQGCREFHILEPLMKYEIKEQLTTRVVRYKSHAHLPKNKQNVKIYQWSCTLFTDINKILHTKVFIAEFFKSIYPYKDYLDLLKIFNNIFSPDDQILGYYNYLNNFVKKFDEAMKAISIDNSTLPLKCCIWTPDNSCSEPSLISCQELN